MAPPAPSEPSLVHALRPHRGEVACLDLFGARLLTGGGDRKLRLWRWAPGDGWQEGAAAAAAHRYGITAVRWSGGGALAASAGIDGATRLWCARTLAARRTLVAPGAAAVRALCWAGEGAGGGRLLAGHDDGALCVWHPARGELVARVLAHEGALHAVGAFAGGALVLTACTHGVMKVFDLVDVCEGERVGRRREPLTWVDCVHDLGALCAEGSHDGAAVATGGHDARIRVWRVTGDGGVAEWGAPLEGHAAAVTALRWGRATPPCGRVLASASLDRTARLWAPEAGGCLHVVSAHTRYLTCIAIADDLRCMVTGSNDKSVRTWSLGSFSLDDELEPPCHVAAHFGIGDLLGIGPVEGEEPNEETEGAEERAVAEEQQAAGDATEARRAWHAQRAHAGAVNCIAAHEEGLATASSDGTVRVWRWCDRSAQLEVQHELRAHSYPVMAVDLGAGAQLLLSAGLDGNAHLWDTGSGVQLRSLCVPTGGAGAQGGEAGGGGVRGGRLSSNRPPRPLLATDDGLAAVWTLSSNDPRPEHVFSGHTEAVTCCAWTCDGRAAATGAASGELRVLRPPPGAATLRHLSPAHDLGVLSCDFAPSSQALLVPEGSYLLATAGCDSLLKLWIVELEQTDAEGDTASVRLVRQVEAHGGAVSCVRWGAGEGARVATAGDDRWARVWRVTDGGERVSLMAAVPAVGAGGTLSVALLSHSLLAVGGGCGELTLWRLPASTEGPDDEETEEAEGATPRFWSEAGVARWLREYISRAPGTPVPRAEEAVLLKRARAARLTGAQLLDLPVDRLIQELGYGIDDNDAEAEAEAEAEMDEKRREMRDETRALLVRELRWLRRGALPAQLDAEAPHALLCPLTHRVMREPARAADGFTYERGALREWLLAADDALSPLTRRRMRNARLQPNYAARDALRAFLEERAADSGAPA